MNLTLDEALQLVASIRVSELSYKHSVVLCPPFLYLSELKRELAGSNMELAAQNCAAHDSGAYTGEVSAAMLASMQIPYTLIGHSERRMYYHETHDVLKAKMDIALKYGLQPIFCCGESQEIRAENKQEEFVLKQLQESLFQVSENDISKVVIAYEPVWAIGTGLNATPEQAQAMHHFIRTEIAKQYGTTVAENMTILYGGSMKPDNAALLFAQPDVDGGLVGGASLKAADFIAIIQACR